MPLQKSINFKYPTLRRFLSYALCILRIFVMQSVYQYNNHHRNLAASRGHNSFQLTKFLSHPLLGHHPTSTYPHCSYGNRPEGVLFRLICGRWVRHFPFWLLFFKVKISSCLHAVLSRTNDVVIDSTYINTFLKSLFLSPFSIISRSVFPSIY